MELPKGLKPVGSKWIFKRNNNADGNVGQRKGMLTETGYTQKCVIGYDSSFCSFVRFESVTTIIVLTAKHNLQLQQLDITTAFVNGELQDNIFMK